MITCKDYDEARLIAISLMADFDSYIKELTITYNKEDKNFIINYEEFSYNEYNEIFDE